MPRLQFAILDTADSAAGLSESNVTTNGIGAAPGSTQCLAIETDGTLNAGAGRAWVFFSGASNFLDATSEIYIDRASSGFSPFLIARVPLQINPNLYLENFDGYVVRLDTDGMGTCIAERVVEGVVGASSSSGPGEYTSMTGTWQRWRLVTRDVGPDVEVLVQRWNGAAWEDVIDWTDTTSPLSGQSGCFGWGVRDRSGGSTWPGPIVRFDDWRCDEA